MHNPLWCNNMKFSNCLIFAVIEALKNGHYITLRKTRHSHHCFFKYHFLVIPKDIAKKHGYSFVPQKDLGKYPLPIFKGSIKQGD